ncbi:hypothetical protein [Streptomyces sp. Amel2xC10]|uniref:hypothetical protein n=1 Tax=Streptomyces sp. Amel2xC10 TaxID=1305826 RepID=UPI000A085AE7|nr:hypothetical protein [Streptomyces sp. Amel2xC10]SMF64677.1 hypothetical protein SAMN02745830_05035 [Streptomyces sp. Amel2xC10]
MNALTNKPAVADDEQRITVLAAGLYVATAAYEAALRRTNPASAIATLDRMCETVDEIMPDVAKVVAAKGGADFAEALRAATTAPLLAFTAIEHARAEAGDGYSYVFDLLVEALEKGADPDTIRTTALDVPRRIRDLAAQAGGAR